MISRTNRPIQCPHCKEEPFTCFSAGDYPSPEPGQWALCTFCGGISLITEEIELRLATAEEMEKLQTDFPNMYAHMMVTQQHYRAQQKANSNYND